MLISYQGSCPYLHLLQSPKLAAIIPNSHEALLQCGFGKTTQIPVIIHKVDSQTVLVCQSNRQLTN